MINMSRLKLQKIFRAVIVYSVLNRLKSGEAKPVEVELILKQFEYKPSEKELIEEIENWLEKQDEDDDNYLQFFQISVRLDTFYKPVLNL